KIGALETVDVPVDTANVDIVLKDGSHAKPVVSGGKVHIQISEDPVFIDEIKAPDAKASSQLDPAEDLSSPTTFRPSARFNDYWQAHGGLPLFGYAITGERLEQSPTDGKTYIVQWFERARFEYHPEFERPPNELLLVLRCNQSVAGSRVTKYWP